MTRDREQGVVYEAEVGRKVLTDGRRKEEEGEERGKNKREKKHGGRLSWSPGVWVDTLWKGPEGT